MNNELMLITGADIPFPEAQLTIHQPRMKEIAMIGEESFLSGCQILNFNKNQLENSDKIGLDSISDFDILMSMMMEKDKSLYLESFTKLLTLVFPNQEIRYSQNEIILFDSKSFSRVNGEHFILLKDVLNNMFCFDEIDTAQKDYNPVGKRAEKIAEKLKKRKKNQEPEKSRKISIFSRYISILAVGERKDLNDLANYTVFQLKDEFERFQKKQSFDMYIQATLAGATGMEEVDSWMEEIHK